MLTAEEVLIKHCPSLTEGNLGGKEKKFKERIIAAMEEYGESCRDNLIKANKSFIKTRILRS